MLVSELISINNTSQLHNFSGLSFPIGTSHVFVCDSENYMENVFGDSFLGQSHLSYRTRAEYGFGAYGFKHRAQWVFPPPNNRLRGLNEFLSAYYLCAKANSPSFYSQNSQSLPQNSWSSLLRNSTLEAAFRPFTKLRKIAISELTQLISP